MSLIVFLKLIGMCVCFKQGLTESELAAGLQGSPLPRLSARIASMNPHTASN